MNLAVLSFLIAVAIWAYQSFVWLQTGLWPEYPLYKLVFWIFGTSLAGTWLLEPRSWIGAHRVVTWFLFIPISGYLFAYSFWKLLQWSFNDTWGPSQRRASRDYKGFP